VFKNNIKKISIDLGNHANDDDEALYQEWELYEHVCKDMAKTALPSEKIMRIGNFRNNCLNKSPSVLII